MDACITFTDKELIEKRKRSAKKHERRGKARRELAAIDRKTDAAGMFPVSHKDIDIPACKQSKKHTAVHDHRRRCKCVTFHCHAFIPMFNLAPGAYPVYCANCVDKMKHIKSRKCTVDAQLAKTPF